MIRSTTKYGDYREYKEKCQRKVVNYEERKKMSEEVLDLDVPNISQG